MTPNFIKILFFSILLFMPGISLIGQSGIVGNIYILNSKHDTGSRIPVVGVKVNADGSNGDFSKSRGEYTLEFKHLKPSKTTKISIGEGDKIQDALGKELELVNEDKLGLVTIPENAREIPIDIIVCHKGARDAAASKYYRILKTSSDLALAEKEKEYNALLKEKKDDYAKINALTNELQTLQGNLDSIAIYKEALHIASINKDDASQRLLRYIQLLEQGESIQEAREALNVEEAKKQAMEGIEKFNSAIEELEIRAKASKAIFDFEDSANCYLLIAELLVKNKNSEIDISNYYLFAARILLRNGNFDKALTFAEKSKVIKERILEADDPLLSANYNDIAVMQEHFGNYKMAIQYFKKSIVIDKKLEDYKSLATSYNNIAMSYGLLSQYDSALVNINRSVQLKAQLVETDSISMAVSYNNLGATHLAMGKYNEAIKYFERTVALREEAFGVYHPEVAMSYNNLASAHENIGHYDLAFKNYYKSILIGEKTLTSDHPELATCYNNISGAFDKVAKADSAIFYQEKAIAIREKVLAKNHPFLATSYNNLGMIYHSIKDYQKALEYLIKSKDIRMALGDSTVELATNFNNLGLTFNALMKYDTARINYQKAIDIQLLKTDSSHPELAKSYNNMGVSYSSSKDYDKAVEYLEKAVDITKRVLPAEHTNRILYFSNLTWVYNKRGIELLNKKLYQEALMDFDTLLVLKPTKEAWNYKGLCHYFSESYSDAINSYLKAAEFSEEYKTSFVFLNNLGTAYIKNKQFEDAFNIMSTLEKLFPDHQRVFRNWAMYYGVKGDKRNALSYIEKAIDGGFDNLDFLENDKSLKSIRQTPEFKELLANLKDKVDHG